ncbi:MULTISPECIES: glycosyltransferase 87 family protein [Streptomycetaceae]|uniref:glycosyltransferase 87 family protein n=1 Tax=Streptomycetaceae TaxID=2062 RepID=UPI001F516BC3|nr:glycosyltransferase 87 family protein [Streptomyces sp. CB02056]
MTKRAWWWCGGWLVAAGWAGAFPVVSGLGPHRSWGAWAACGYLLAALAVVLVRRRGREVSVAVAALGAVLVPLLLLVLDGRGQSEVGVIERSGSLLLHTGMPYLAEPRTVEEYTPYLPGMALLGLPRALLDGTPLGGSPLGDARLWCAAVFLVCVLRTVPAGRRLGAAALTASPVVALPLCVSGVDLPLTGLCWLALVRAAERRPVAAGLALAAACALKWTAWPALAVVAALLAATAGRRAALRGVAVAVGAAALAVLPVALRAPGPLVEQVFAFPTGRGGLPTPAASPLPGRLLADLGPAGWCAAVGLLLLAGLAVGASLAVRPPRTAPAAVHRLALGLTAAFLLAPAGRFGYLALPLVLVLLSLSSSVSPSLPSSVPLSVPKGLPWAPPSSSPTTSRRARAASKPSSRPWPTASPVTTSWSTPRPNRVRSSTTPLSPTR